MFVKLQMADLLNEYLKVVNRFIIIDIKTKSTSSKTGCAYFL